MRIFVIFLALLFHPLAIAQTSVGVHIASTANDSVGRQFVYELREKIRASHGLRLENRSVDAIIRLKIVTLDPISSGLRGNIGDNTIYSIVFTFRPMDRDAEIYWGNFVGICGASKIESCARNIVAEI